MKRMEVTLSVLVPDNIGFNESLFRAAVRLREIARDLPIQSGDRRLERASADGLVHWAAELKETT